MIDSDLSAGVGLEGGRGSFNDSAWQRYAAARGLDCPVHYLHTAEGVLDGFERGAIAIGQMALSNSAAGIYRRNVRALLGYRRALYLVDEHRLRVRHALMALPGTSLDELVRVVTHPEVIRQCRDNLGARLAALTIEPGHGDLADPASVARAIAQQRLPTDVGVVSNPALAEVWGLEILASDLEDSTTNRSTFVILAPSPVPSGD